MRDEHRLRDSQLDYASRFAAGFMAPRAVAAGWSAASLDAEMVPDR